MPMNRIKKTYGDKEVGNRLKSLREKRGLCKGYIVEQIDISESLYSKYESGERMLQLDTGIKLAELYGVSLDYIYLGRNIPGPAGFWMTEQEAEDFYELARELLKAIRLKR